MVQSTNKKPPSIEQLLQGVTERLEKHALGWRAVVLNLSHLRPDANRAGQIRIAGNTFQASVQQFDGQIFVLHHGDIAFLCKDADGAALDAAIAKIRSLFSDDPLASKVEDPRIGSFATAYDLERDYEKFVTYVRQVVLEEDRRQKRLSMVAGNSQKDQRQPMDPQGLVELMATIGHADLTNVLRRQSVCSIVSGEAPKPIYRELYISIPDLRDTFMPRREIASDRWLFQYLTQTLDRRVLAILTHTADPTLTHSYSVNLNVSTLLSPEFQNFDQSLRPGTRGSITIELEKVDIFNDLGAYMFARDYAHERGYRICLDGATALTLPFIDRDRLGIDLVKVFWTNDINGKQRSGRASEVRDAIERIGKSRIILAHCADAEAIQFGLDCGVRLFQGRYVDRLLTGSGSAAGKGAAAAPRAAASG